MSLVEIGEIGTGIDRVLVLVPERRGVTEGDVGILLGEVNDEGTVVAKEVARMRLAPSRLIIDSIDLATASVSGTFSSSTTVMPDTAFSAATETAWA